MEELLKLALKRVQPAASEAAAAPAAVVPLQQAALPPEVERAVQVLEHANAEALGDAGVHEVVHRLLPFLHAALRRLHIELPAQTIMEKLKAKAR